jgi:hypothetical protein
LRRDLQADENRANRGSSLENSLRLLSVTLSIADFLVHVSRQKDDTPEAGIHRQDQFLALAHLSLHFSNKIPVNPKKTVNPKIAMT